MFSLLLLFHLYLLQIKSLRVLAFALNALGFAFSLSGRILFHFTFISIRPIRLLVPFDCFMFGTLCLFMFSHFGSSQHDFVLRYVWSRLEVAEWYVGELEPALLHGEVY